MQKNKAFSFGKNWERFLKKNYSQQRLETAQEHLLRVLDLADLNGLTFLDIGSGSGLHSLAALQAGAKQVVSFDYDIDSIAAASMLRQWSGSPDNWSIVQGSVLDLAFMQNLPKFDIVYSWGVLPFTGNLEQAIQNTAIPLTDNGLLYIALYSETRYRDGTLLGYPAPEEWMDIKAAYNKRGAIGKRLMEARHIYRSYLAAHMPNISKAWKNLRESITNYKARSRGMEFWTDVRDWLGGWPVEFIKERQCLELCHQLGLTPLTLLCGQGNTEYLFAAKSSFNDSWNAKRSGLRKVFLANERFQHEQGHMYSCPMPENTEKIDFIWEGDLPLGYYGSPPQAVAAFGEGRHNIWDGKLFFSSNDNSAPVDNGKSYYITYFV